MNMSYNITPVSETDLAAIAALEEACFSHPWSMEMLRGSLLNGRSCFLAAKDGGTLLGYLGMEYILDEGSITNVAVLPEYRRQGIARALLATLLEEARRLSLATVTLEVRASNEAAIALYEGMGFLPVGRRFRYYNDPTEDALLMTADLLRKE